ncbi:MAG TPA: CBS domain-containing protein [Gemmatimonadales bacterium]|nr:CBS domain-containing protein [Gemmatimonadales bacterium]
MHKVQEFMTRDVVTLSPDLPLREAIGIFDERHISGAPVVAAGRVVGVFSASDVMQFESATPGVPTARGEPDVFESLADSEEWEEGAETPAAFFTDWWSDAGADVLERIRDLDRPEWDLLGEHTVSEAMSRRILSVRSDQTIAEAARYMLRAGVHRLLVVDEGDLVGILTSTDIVRSAAHARH